MVMGLAGAKGPNVFNAHERVLPASPAAVWALVQRLGSENDPIWPGERWPRLRLEGPLELGAHAGHGPFRYYVDDYEPGQVVRFRFSAPPGFMGHHEFVVERAAGGRGEGGAGDATRLRHVVTLSLSETNARITWALIWRPLHDALIEDALDRAQAAVTGQPVPQREWPGRVKLLRRLVGSRLKRG